MPQPISDAAVSNAYSYAWTLPSLPVRIRPDDSVPEKRDPFDPARQFRDWLREFQDERTGGVSPPPMA